MGGNEREHKSPGDDVVDAVPVLIPSTSGVCCPLYLRGGGHTICQTAPVCVRVCALSQSLPVRWDGQSRTNWRERKIQTQR